MSIQQKEKAHIISKFMLVTQEISKYLPLSNTWCKQYLFLPH